MPRGPTRRLAAILPRGPPRHLRARAHGGAAPVPPGRGRRLHAGARGSRRHRPPADPRPHLVRRGPAAPPSEPAPRRPPCPPALLPRSDTMALAPRRNYLRPASPCPACSARRGGDALRAPAAASGASWAARLPREERGLGAPPGTTFPAEGLAVVKPCVMASEAAPGP